MDILRGHAFPQHVGDDEETDEDVQGNVQGDSCAGPPANGASHHSAGQSSSLWTSYASGLWFKCFAFDLGLTGFLKTHVILFCHRLL